MTETKSAQADGVGLLKKGFQILDAFRPDTPTWSQVELARATGLTKSTTSRLVRYLCDCGYLTCLTSSGRYRLGPAAIELGRRAANQFSLVDVALPVLERLSVATAETVILTELNEYRHTAVCAHQIESRRDGLRVFENVGAEFHLHEGAAPRAILATLPDDERDAVLSGDLRGRTSRSLTSVERLQDVIRETRTRGYAVSREETYEGVVGIAAAILWPDKRPVGSVAIAAPILRYDEARIAEFGELLTHAAHEVSALLSGEGREKAA